MGISAIGMTYVILAGGIDLSVGSVVGLTSIVSAVAVERHHLSPLAVIPFVLAGGAVFGAAMGALIQFFELPAFLVTLAGMFLARGLAHAISLESIELTHPLYRRIPELGIPLGAGLTLPAIAILFLATLAVAAYLAGYTRFGRDIYALGGNEQSALLMGLPVARTRIAVYVWSGFCASLAGVVYTFYTASGNSTSAAGLELDAIASVVIGGTLLTGGSGTVLGTLLGVLILGVIQTTITFESLSSWWAKIAIGALLFLFVSLQRIVTRTRRAGAA